MLLEILFLYQLLYKIYIMFVEKYIPINQILYKYLHLSNTGKSFFVPVLISLQVTHFYVSRLGGPDPLDYISMFDNDGLPEMNIPPHWHYVRYHRRIIV